MAPRRLIAAVAFSSFLATGQAGAAAATRTTVFSDIVVNEPVTGDVLAVEADVHLGPMADVDGDVVVVGGDLRLDERARIGRHALAIFGRVEAAPGALVEGRILSFSSLSSVVLHPSEGSSLQIDLAVRLLTSGGWLLVTTALAFGLSTRLRYGVWMLPQLGLRVLALGVAAGITFFAAIVAVLGFGPRIGVPAAAALTVIFFVLRAVGLTVIGGWLAGRLLARLGRRPWPLTVEVFVGVLALLVVRFVPLIGGALWSVCAIAALGTGIIVLAATLSAGDPVTGLASPSEGPAR